MSNENLYVTILGRSNSGKSSLFNRLANKNLSIVSEIENTTSDYISVTTNNCILSDTAGLLTADITKDPILYKIIEKSSKVLYVIDGSVHISSLDINAIKKLRKTVKDIILIVNKTDKGIICNYHILGIEKIFLTSIKNDDGIEEIQEYLNLESVKRNNIPIIGIIGKCNSGKSTLMNALLGFERMKTSEIAGSTQDSVVEESYKVCYMDTAGYKNINNKLDHISAARRHQALKYCDGVILVLDGSTGLETTDKFLIQESEKYGWFKIIAINKKDELVNEDYRSFKHANFSETPVTYTCGRTKDTGEIRKLINQHIKMIDIKIPTPQLNKLLARWKEENTILTPIKYICQTGNKPIEISFSSSKNVSNMVTLYLKRKIKEFYKLSGMTVKIKNNKSQLQKK